ncbi:MAG: hypothetical protein DRJ05_12960 [Bacteroidetes bacterium]|nr:MAG: hypothetical protein DRJ05_12960 [Bacteroidota bacterium]
MGQLLLTIPDEEINVVLKFIKEFNPKIKIMSFNEEKDDFLEIDKTDEVLKPSDPINWALSGRPATDEEFDQLVAEMEAEEKAGLGMSAEESEAYVTKRIEEWEMNRK